MFSLLALFLSVVQGSASQFPVFLCAAEHFQELDLGCAIKCAHGIGMNIGRIVGLTKRNSASKAKGVCGLVEGTVERTVWRM